jgi:hypothetical protein
VAVRERDGRIAALVVEAVPPKEPLTDLEAGGARREFDEKVVRIIPVEYSDVITSTASTAAAIAPNQTPARLSMTMSLSPPCPGLPPSVLDPDVRSEVKRIEIPTKRRSDQVVLRTVLSLTHSERSACGAPALVRAPAITVVLTTCLPDAPRRTRPRRA